MVEVKHIVEKFQSFRSNFNIPSVVGGLLLEIVENNNPSTGEDSPDDKSGNWGNPVNGAINSNVSQELLPSNASRTGFIICNLDTSNWIYINFNAPAATDFSVYILQPGQTLVIEGTEASDSINAIASTGETNITYREAIANG